MTDRRTLLRGATAALSSPWLLMHADAADNHDAVAKLLRTGGCVIAFRHALAPGTFDPPNFRLGACITQRNLSDEGREQARRIGAWFVEQRLVPAAVRSSPWCRCIETAKLAFNSVTPWAALGSPRGATESTNRESLQALRAALVKARTQPGRFEAWVSHMFVWSDLVQNNSAAGEGLVLQADAAGAPVVLARLLVPSKSSGQRRALYRCRT